MIDRIVVHSPTSKFVPRTFESQLENYHVHAICTLKPVNSKINIF